MLNSGCAENGIVSVGLLEGAQPVILCFLMSFTQAGCAEKTIVLVTIVFSAPKTIEIALFALNLLNQLNLVLFRRIYSQTLGQALKRIHFHMGTPFPLCDY
jgi:hypothetical protein